MRYVDLHAHMASRTTDDYEQMALTGCVAYSISFVYRLTAHSIGGAIGRLIAGISLFDALVLADVGSWVGVAFAAAAFAATLFFQHYIRGT